MISEALYDLTDDDFARYQSSRESQVRSYPRRLPIVVKKAEGAWVWDTRGQKYLDCLAGAGALPLGYCHPELNAEIARRLAEGLPYQTLDIATPTKLEFIAELLAFLPDLFSKTARIQFCGPSGSDAIEAAVKLAKLHTQRTGIVSFQGGYHGMTSGSLALTGNLAAKERRRGLMPDVQFFPYPYGFRCPFGLGGDDGARMGLRYIESVLSDVESGTPRPAAFLLEPIQGEGGVIPAPAFWLQEIRRITREHGILLILDEVQSGIGRTGQHFAFQESGVLPDILVLSKAVGGGLPLSVLVFDQAIDCWRGGEHSGTFRGNQLAMVTGLKTLKIIQRDSLCDQAARRGSSMMARFRQLAQTHDCIGEVRGRGLMIGVELIKPGERNRLGQPDHAAERASRIQTEALRRGLILERGGRHGCVLRFLPPLILEEGQVDYCADILDRAIRATS